MDATFKQLRYFVALAETGNFGTAAARVHVSQPALSLQIKELEANLGVRLVDRLPRSLQLTRAGQAVLERAEVILTEMDDLQQAVRWHDGLSGKLKLGVIPTIAPYLLPQALVRIRAQDLALDIRVHEATTETLLSSLRSGRLDVAVVALPIDERIFSTYKLFDDHFLLAGSFGQLKRWRENAAAISPESVTAEHLLLLDEGHCLADQALEVCNIKTRGNVDMGASSLSTLSGLVAKGFGLTLLPELALRTEIAASPDLHLLRFDGQQPKREIALVRRANSNDEGWFQDLGLLLRDAAKPLLEFAAAKE